MLSFKSKHVYVTFREKVEDNIEEFEPNYQSVTEDLFIIIKNGNQLSRKVMNLLFKLFKNIKNLDNCGCPIDFEVIDTKYFPNVKSLSIQDMMQLNYIIDNHKY